jgi:hypothetical protein
MHLLENQWLMQEIIEQCDGRATVIEKSLPCRLSIPSILISRCGIGHPSQVEFLIQAFTSIGESPEFVSRIDSWLSPGGKLGDANISDITVAQE